MATRSKVYLPKWMQWFIGPLLLLVWLLVTYQAFGAAGEGQDIGMTEWLAVTAIMIFIGGALWLMTSGRLPAYVIEHEDEPS